MITKFINEQIEEIILDESFINGLLWTGENGINLEILIDWCGQENLKNKFNFENINTKLLFEYCYEIDFNFKHQNPYTLGNLEITKFKYTKIENNNYLIEFIFDFSPKGSLKFYCNNFIFIIEHL
jgi:hypothetical protein